VFKGEATSCWKTAGVAFCFGDVEMAEKIRRPDSSTGSDRPWNDSTWRPSDHELLNMVLEINDYRSLTDLVDRIPPGVSALRIEQVYKSQEKLSCANPGCPARHNKGFIVRLSNNQVAHVGHICGRKIFPDQGRWEEQKAAMEWKIKRQDYLRRIQPLEKNIITALNMLKGWQGPFLRFRQLRQHMRDFYHPLYEQLNNAARGNGQLQIPRRRRARIREEVEGQKGKNSKIYENYLDTYGQLRGTKVFMNPGPYSILATAESELGSIKARLGAPSLRNDEMAELLQRVRKVADNLQEAYSRYLAMAEFTQLDHLKLLSRFANDHPQLGAAKQLPWESPKETDYDLVQSWGRFESEPIDLTVIDLLRGLREQQSREVA
jgi:hypothetical protein